jgi:hypothetical protein
METDLSVGMETKGKDWYACPPASVAEALGIDPAGG